MTETESQQGIVDCNRLLSTAPESGAPVRKISRKTLSQKLRIMKHTLPTNPSLLCALVVATILTIAAFATRAEQTGTSEPANPKAVLEQLEEDLGEVETVKTEFIQKKELAVFERTMVIKGQMAVKNPDRMAWRVDEPVKYTMVIHGARLEQWDEDTDKVQKLKLDRDPAFQAVFEQLTVWFSGRYSSLTDKYNLTIEQTAPYILVFTPKEGTMFEKMIKRVKVEFREDARYIRKLMIEEGSGDRTTIEFHDTRLNVPLDDETWEVRSR